MKIYANGMCRCGLGRYSLPRVCYSAVVLLLASTASSAPPQSVIDNPDFLVQLAVKDALGTESEKFTETTFKGVTLGDPHTDEDRKSNAPPDAPHWLSVPPHQAVENNGRIESTRIFVESEGNRIVMVSTDYARTPFNDMLPDILQTFGKTPQEIVETKWMQGGGPAKKLVLRYTFPKTLVRVIATGYTAPFPHGATQVWVYDRAFVEKSLLEYGRGIVEACKWLDGMRQLSEKGHIEVGDALPIEGCEIREWNNADGRTMLYVDTKRKQSMEAAFKSAQNGLPKGLGQGGTLQPFDVALISSNTRETLMVVCPDASTFMRPPELKLVADHLDGTILSSPISDAVVTVTSGIVQVFFPPAGDHITTISRTNDTLWEPTLSEDEATRPIQIRSRAGGDRLEWTDKDGWEVRVTNWGAVSLGRKKAGGL